jgi:O-antigen ligase
MSLALDIASEYPWFGVGYAGYSGAVWSYGPQLYFPPALDHSILEVFVSTASNQLFQTLADGGIIGLAALSSLVLSAILILARARQASTGRLRTEASVLLAWCAAFAVGNQTACWLLPNSLIGFMWFLSVGTGAAILSISRFATPVHPFSLKTSKE